MANLLEETATYLANNGIGTLGKSIFVGYAPDEPRDVVVLYPTGGLAPDALSGKEYPSMQIMVRSSSARNGMTKAMAVLDLLHKQSNILSTVRGRCFAEQSLPMHIGRGANGEFLYVINFMWLITS